MSMPIRSAACLVAAALLCACSGPKAATTAASATPAAASASEPAGPPNAPVAAAGRAGAVPLEPGQRADLSRAVAALPPGVRPRLRYALAAGDDGKPQLVVYDGEGLGATGHHAGKSHDYVVFKVLNGAGGRHYDPQQNALIAPIPPPAQRESAATP
jgi:hypothetical protein